MLRRRTKTPEPPPTTSGVEGGLGAGKGRPTPKRREAEQERRQRVKPTMDRKEARRRAREDARAARERRRQGLLAGDPRLLPPRDQGPVRAYVRDFIDSRRSVAEFFLIAALVILVLLFLPVPALQQSVGLIWTFMLIVIIVDSTVLGLRLSRSLRRRFPTESRKGAIAYGIMRSTQLRRLRLPPPRVKPGATI